MKVKNPLIFSSILLCGICLFSNQLQAATISSDVKQPKSAKQRVAANHERRNLDFTDLGKDYTDFKNYLAHEYGFDYAVDISYMGQRGAPNGDKTSYQTIISPSFTWQTFQNEYGTGTLNFGYNVVRYGGISAEKLGNNIGAVTGINDFTTKSSTFNELYYSYQLGGSWDWLTVALGQFPLYNFDGSTYNSNQQVNFVSEALSQNASSTYSIAGVGT